MNVNVSNAIAAIFTATGQDTACVSESSSAILIIEPLSAEEMNEHHLKGMSE